MPLPLDVPGRPDERVARQLVAAMAFEGLIDASALPRAGTGRLSWASAAGAFRCIAWRGPFGRIRVAAGSLHLDRDDGASGEPTLAELVGSIRAPGASKGRLLKELEATAAACRLVAADAPSASRRAMDFDALDAAIHEGHPYHPSLKARLGFATGDHRTFGPEFGASFRLHWVAVDRSRLAANLPRDEAAFMEDMLGAEAWGDLRAAMRNAGLSLEQHGLLPVHPWQMRHLGEAFRATGRIHPLGAFGDRYRASQSLRTVINADRPGAPNVKLPLDVTNTSTVRSLDPPSVLAAPVLSDWLATVIASDPLFAGRYPLAILKEFAGITAERDGPLSGQLGVILRENAAGKLEPGEAAVPFNALALMEDDGLPLIDEWVRRHGLFRLVDRIVEAVVLPLWHLLVTHGIATECHGQNLVLVHRDGWPTRLVLRDFHDSLEYVPGFLAAPDPKEEIVAIDPAYADPAPNRFFWMERVEDLRWLVMDCLFVHTLSDLSLLFERAYGLPEAAFWKRVARALDRYASEHPVAARLERLGHLAPLIATEPLLRRKLDLWQDGQPWKAENELCRHDPALRTERPALRSERPALQSERKEHEDDDQDRRHVF
jgi:3,4-dihydroxybenzoyl-citryl-spermidine/N-citryl-spermidine--spermidine ligase